MAIATRVARAFVRQLHATPAHWKDLVIPVPQMAESITEGTIAQVMKGVGQAVALDEVICVLETDKVAFEVRAPEAGVVKSVAVEAGQTVGVGAPIMVLDTDGKASASATAPSPAPAAAAPKPAAAAPAPAPAPVAAADSHSRVPSIRFRHGNRGAINAEIGLSGAAGSSSAKPASKAAAPKAAPAPVFTGSYAEQVAKAFPSKAGSKTYLDLPPAFGRPRISEAEARAIESGGAY